MANSEHSAEELFAVALDLPPDSRAAFLDQACQSVVIEIVTGSMDSQGPGSDLSRF